MALVHRCECQSMRKAVDESKICQAWISHDSEYFLKVLVVLLSFIFLE